jgi:hypothetical protein
MFFIYNVRLGIEADMHFVSNSIHLYVHHCWCFTNKVALEKSDHGDKNKENRILRSLIKSDD